MTEVPMLSPEDLEALYFEKLDSLDGGTASRVVVHIYGKRHELEVDGTIIARAEWD